jgi:hypothetical protein
MAYDMKVAERVRQYLSDFSKLNVEEKKIFGGLAFIVKRKMCINVSGEKLMCRYDPALHEEVAVKTGYKPMMMKGKELKGYCYVDPFGFKLKKDFEYWIGLCLDYNETATSSKRKK